MITQNFSKGDEYDQQLEQPVEEIKQQFQMKENNVEVDVSHQNEETKFQLRQIDENSSSKIKLVITQEDAVALRNDNIEIVEEKRVSQQLNLSFQIPQTQINFIKSKKQSTKKQKKNVSQQLEEQVNQKNQLTMQKNNVINNNQSEVNGSNQNSQNLTTDTLILSESGLAWDANSNDLTQSCSKQQQTFSSRNFYNLYLFPVQLDQNSPAEITSEINLAQNENLNIVKLVTKQKQPSQSTEPEIKKINGNTNEPPIIANSNLKKQKKRPKPKPKLTNNNPINGNGQEMVTQVDNSASTLVTIMPPLPSINNSQIAQPTNQQKKPSQPKPQIQNQQQFEEEIKEDTIEQQESTIAISNNSKKVTKKTTGGNRKLKVSFEATVEIIDLDVIQEYQEMYTDIKTIAKLNGTEAPSLKSSLKNISQYQFRPGMQLQFGENSNTNNSNGLGNKNQTPDLMVEEKKISPPTRKAEDLTQNELETCRRRFFESFQKGDAMENQNQSDSPKSFFSKIKQSLKNMQETQHSNRDYIINQESASDTVICMKTNVLDQFDLDDKEGNAESFKKEENQEFKIESSQKKNSKIEGHEDEGIEIELVDNQNNKFKLQLQISPFEQSTGSSSVAILRKKLEELKDEKLIEQAQSNPLFGISNPFDITTRNQYFESIDFIKDYQSGYAPIDKQEKEKKNEVRLHFIRRKQSSASINLKRTCGVSYVSLTQSDQRNVSHIYQKLPHLVFQCSSGCERLQSQSQFLKVLFNRLFQQEEKNTPWLLCTIFEAEDEQLMRDYLVNPAQRFEMVKGKYFLLKSVANLWPLFIEKFFLCVHMIYDEVQLIKNPVITDFSKEKIKSIVAQTNIHFGFLLKRSLSGRQSFLKTLMENFYQVKQPDDDLLSNNDSEPEEAAVAENIDNEAAMMIKQEEQHVGVKQRQRKSKNTPRKSELNEEKKNDESENEEGGAGGMKKQRSGQSSTQRKQLKNSLANDSIQGFQESQFVIKDITPEENLLIRQAQDLINKDSDITKYPAFQKVYKHCDQLLLEYLRQYQASQNSASSVATTNIDSQISVQSVEKQIEEEKQQFQMKIESEISQQKEDKEIPKIDENNLINQLSQPEIKKQSGEREQGTTFNCVRNFFEPNVSIQNNMIQQENIPSQSIIVANHHLIVEDNNYNPIPIAEKIEEEVQDDKNQQKVLKPLVLQDSQASQMKESRVETIFSIKMNIPLPENFQNEVHKQEDEKENNVQIKVQNIEKIEEPEIVGLEQGKLNNVNSTCAAACKEVIEYIEKEEKSQTIYTCSIRFEMYVDKKLWIESSDFTQNLLNTFTLEAKDQLQSMGMAMMNTRFQFHKNQDMEKLLQTMVNYIREIVYTEQEYQDYHQKQEQMEEESRISLNVVNLSSLLETDQKEGEKDSQRKCSSKYRNIKQKQNNGNQAKLSTDQNEENLSHKETISKTELQWDFSQENCASALDLFAKSNMGLDEQCVESIFSNTQPFNIAELLNSSTDSELIRHMGALAMPLYYISTRDSFAYDLIKQVTPMSIHGRNFFKTQFFFDPRNYPANFQNFVDEFPDFRVGVTSYTQFFTHEEMKQLQDGCFETEVKSFQRHYLPMTSQATCTAEQVRRTKFFFGYRYIWSKVQLCEPHSNVGAGVRCDVSNPPQWMWEKIVRPLQDAGIVQKDFLNSFALNVYHDGQEGLAQHFDDAVRFKQPIFTIRMFSDSRLSFGSQFYGFCNGAFTIPLPRGCICVMEENSYAANGVKHCIRPCDMKGKSAAVILRQMHERVVREATMYDEFVDLPTWVSTLSQNPHGVPYGDQRQLEAEYLMKKGACGGMKGGGY